MRAQCICKLLIRVDNEIIIQYLSAIFNLCKYVFHGNMMLFKSELSNRYKKFIVNICKFKMANVAVFNIYITYKIICL